jgi:hypothetical protein
MHNYDIDGSDLKPEHVAFLNTYVLPILNGADSRCWLQGSASHSGSDAHNLGLSQKRVDGVVAYLVSRGASRNRLIASAVGESGASMASMEAAADRAVSLFCAPLAKPQPVPSVPPSPAPKTNTRFRIRELGGISGGAGPIGFDQLFFQLWDQANSVSTFYNYRAGGFAKGAKGGPPLSATLQGPWNDFTTSGPLATHEFGGAARFTSAGALWWTVNFVNFMGLPRGLMTNPNPLKINTGFTVGLGASTSVGAMVLGPTYPFTGP